MEYIAVLSLLAIGSVLNDTKASGVLFQKRKQNLNPISSPYESTRSIDVRHGEEARAAQVYSELKDPSKARIIAGPTEVLLPQTDYQDKTLPIEFSQHGYETKQVEIPAPKTEGQHSGTDFTTGGVYGISLTGQPIDSKNFRHNNMVPFFGSRVKQNMDEFANATQMEHFTGTPSTYQEKHEIKTMFTPERNVGNVYGASNLDGYMKDRYIPSRLRQGEAPTDKVRVGPGLAAGYTACGKGGFHDFDSQEYAKPKTVDELRVLTKPKVSYYGRVVAGKHIARTAKIGVVQKNRPDTYFENTPDRYFTTTGATSGATQRSAVVLKNMENRKKSRSYMGPAGPAAQRNAASRNSRFRASTKTSYEGQYGTVAATGFWSALMGTLTGYGRNDCDAKTTRKETTAVTEHWGNVAGVTSEPTRDGKAPRRTRRIYLDENSSNMNLTGAKAMYVHDKQPVKTTVKEQTQAGDHYGVAAGEEAGPVWDPEDVARTTVKQQTIEDDHLGPATAAIKEAPAGDNDPLKTTNKETTHVEEHFGGVVGTDDSGYLNENVEARETNRQTCTGEVLAPAHRATGEGYAVTNNNINLTERSQYEDIGYTPGMSGPSEIPNKKGMNATTRRTADMKNDAIRSRGVSSTRVINSIPTMTIQNMTRTRTRLPIREISDRTSDPALLTAFRSNPYTQSLASFFWN